MIVCLTLWYTKSKLDFDLKGSDVNWFCFFLKKKDNTLILCTHILEWCCSKAFPICLKEKIPCNGLYLPQHTYMGKFFSQINSRLSFQWCTQTSSHQLFVIYHIYWDLWCYNLWFVHWKIVGIKERLCKFVFLIQKTNREISYVFYMFYAYIKSVEETPWHPQSDSVVLATSLSTWVKYPGPTW